MYLSILRLWNFRKYAGADNKPGLEIHFQKGVNVLIGENDSGKTAIVDAIRYVLRTQSGEFIQFEDKDFYQDSDGNRKDEFKIECVFDGLNEQDAGLFWEWLSWNDDKTKYLLKVWLYVKRKDNVIMPTFSAEIDGQADRMDSEAREVLKVVYFKPLSDALTDMTHGYKSRLAQILGSHELLKTTIIDYADTYHNFSIEDLFTHLHKKIDINRSSLSWYLFKAGIADLVNKRPMAEQIAGLEMLRYQSPNIRHDLFYWVRQARNLQAEIDYLTSHLQNVLPVEVKAGTQGGMKSLWLFMREEQLSEAVRCSLENFGTFDYIDNEAAAVRHVHTCPLYAISMMHSSL